MGGGISIDGSGSPFPGGAVGPPTGGLAVGGAGLEDALGSSEADAGGSLAVAEGTDEGGDVPGSADELASGDDDGSATGRPQLDISVPTAIAATSTARARITKPTTRRREISFTGGASLGGAREEARRSPGGPPGSRSGAERRLLLS